MDVVSEFKYSKFVLDESVSDVADGGRFLGNGMNLQYEWEDYHMRDYVFPH